MAEMESSTQSLRRRVLSTNGERVFAGRIAKQNVLKAPCKVRIGFKWKGVPCYRECCHCPL